MLKWQCNKELCIFKEREELINLRKSILALSVVAGIVAAPMTVFAAHTHSWGSPQYYGYEDEMPGIYDDWDKCATRHVYNYKLIIKK